MREARLYDYYRINGGRRRLQPAMDALVEQGACERVRLAEDGGPALVMGGTADRLGETAPRGAFLLAPFDNLLWDRIDSAITFGFEHSIEIYKRSHERVWGYYVLPLVDGSRGRRPRRYEGRPAGGRAARAAGSLAGPSPPTRAPRGARETRLVAGTARNGGAGWSSRRARSTWGRSLIRSPASVNVPIYQTSTYAQDGVNGMRGGHDYARIDQPDAHRARAVPRRRSRRPTTASRSRPA